MNAVLARARTEYSEEPARIAPSQAPAHPLRVVFCTRGGLFGDLVLERLLACDRVELCGIVRSSRVFSPRWGFVRGALAFIRRCGIAYSLYLFCATTVADVVRTIARKAPRLSVPAHTTRNVNDAAGLRFLRECAPDLIVSAFFDQRLEEIALSIPARGSVNIHPSLLPAFRGVEPVLQAKLQSAPSIGVTVHRMTAALDAGNILAQQSIDLRDDASVFEATARLLAHGTELLIGTLEGVARAEPGLPQSAGGSYESWPVPAELRALRVRGGRLFRLRDLRLLRI